MRADVSRSVPWEIPLAEHGIAGEVENPVPITAAPADDGDQTLAASVLAFDIKSTSQVCVLVIRVYVRVSTVCAAVLHQVVALFMSPFVTFTLV